MKSNQLLKLTKRKLVEKLEKTRKDLLDLSFEVKMGQSQDHASIKKKRKDVARMMTVLNNEIVVEGKEAVKKAVKKIKVDAITSEGAVKEGKKEVVIKKKIKKESK